MLFAVGFLLPVPARRADRRDAGLAADRLPRSTTRTSSSPTCTTCCSAARCSRCSPASTTGSRSSPAGCCTRAGASVHFVLMFVGFHLTFLVQHMLGARGHAPPGRRLPARRRLHRRSTASRRSARSCSASSTLPFLWNVWRTLRRGRAGRRRPVGRPHARVGHHARRRRRTTSTALPPHPLEPAGVGPEPPRPPGATSDGRRRRRHRRPRTIPSATTPGAETTARLRHPGPHVRRHRRVPRGHRRSSTGSSPTRRPAPSMLVAGRRAGLHDRRLPRLDEAAAGTSVDERRAGTASDGAVVPRTPASGRSRSASALVLVANGLLLGALAAPARRRVPGLRHRRLHPAVPPRRDLAATARVSRRRPVARPVPGSRSPA